MHLVFSRIIIAATPNYFTGKRVFQFWWLPQPYMVFSKKLNGDSLPGAFKNFHVFLPKRCFVRSMPRYRECLQFGIIHEFQYAVLCVSTLGVFWCSFNHSARVGRLGRSGESFPQSHTVWGTLYESQPYISTFKHSMGNIYMNPNHTFPPSITHSMGNIYTNPNHSFPPSITHRVCDK